MNLYKKNVLVECPSCQSFGKYFEAASLTSCHCDKCDNYFYDAECGIIDSWEKYFCLYKFQWKNLIIYRKRSILIITEVPNSNAQPLTHGELFDIKTNPFSQFVGRLLLGSERDVSNHFNEKNFIWMHALGSTTHGNEHKDGVEAILQKIKSDDFDLIVIFGGKAGKVFFPNFTFSVVESEFKQGIKRCDQINTKNKFPKIKSLVSIFPHPSGRAQHTWMQHPVIFSNMLNQIQEKTHALIFHEPVNENM